MAEPFIGEIKMVGFNFAPRGWAFCNGQLLPISSNSALFSLLGTIYGGDGRTDFALPDLRGRVPIHEGQGPGLSDYRLGSRGGVEEVTLTTAQLPTHNHALLGSSGTATQGTPLRGSLPTGPANSRGQTTPLYANTVPNEEMNTTSIGNAGGSQPFSNRMPFTVVNFCIALEGTFPSRS